MTLSVMGLLTLWMSISVAQATPLTLNPSLDVQGQGLTLVEGGVGTVAFGNTTATISVAIGGPVQEALLYWAGRQRPCDSFDSVTSECLIPSQPYPDQLLTFDGNAVTGTIIGTETQPDTNYGPMLNIGYRADVTSFVRSVFVGAGNYSFGIADGDLTSDLTNRGDPSLDGAGLLVIYTDPNDSNTYRVMVFEGMDFAYALDSTAGDPRETAPITFSYDAEGSLRAGELLIFAGDADLDRPDLITISDNPDQVNELRGADGDSWDTLNVGIDILADVGQTTVQLFSQVTDSSAPGDPDSLLWIMGALRLPVEVGEPSIDIEKDTNGFDADTVTGPTILVGEPVLWTYEVTNTGNVPLVNVVVTDDQGVAVSCPGNTLAVGASMSCTGNGTAALGQYHNLGTVTGDAPDATQVMDTDPSHYIGEEVIVGGQGCTPGYWKQKQHFDSWVGYSPTDDFDAAFAVTSSFGSGFTLLNALKQGGGGEKAMGRHAIAALLNTTNSGVDYAFTTSEVIALVQQAYVSGDFEGVKNQFADENELGCMLN